MKRNFLFEAYHYSLHVIKVFLGIDSYYPLRHHRRQKLKEMLIKFNPMNDDNRDKPEDSQSPRKPKYPFPPNSIK